MSLSHSVNTDVGCRAATVRLGVAGSLWPSPADRWYYQVSVMRFRMLQPALCLQ